MHYLYSIINQLNNKVYIGQAVNAQRRWKEHQRLSLKNPVQYIHRAMAKHGVENFTFTIIDCALNHWQADCIEICLIKHYETRNLDKGYNLKSGGKTWDDEFRQKMSEANKQRYRDNPELKDKLAEYGKLYWDSKKDKMHCGDASTLPPSDGKYLLEWRKNNPEQVAANHKAVGEYNKLHPNSGQFKKGHTNSFKRTGMAPTNKTVLTPEQEQQLIQDYQSGDTINNIAKVYHISDKRVSTIVRSANLMRKAGRK